MFLSSVNMNAEYTCGSGSLVFTGTIPYVVSLIVTVIKILVPILLVVFGMLDLGKAVMASKEDEIKKGQQTLIKRVVAAVLVFFVIQIAQVIFRFVSGSDANVVNCFNCFVNGAEGPNACENVNVVE